jgi:hypothetical protein
MARNLWSKIAKGAAIVVTGLALKACPFPCTPQAPKTTVYVSPQYGKAPLESRLKVSGEDLNNDINEYVLKIDRGNDGSIEEEIRQATPIDITRTFNTGTTRIYGSCTDATGLTDVEYTDLVASNSAIPTVDFSGVNADVAETRTRTVTLPNPTDSDNPGTIPYTNVEVLSGDVTPSLNGNQLTVQSNSPTSQEVPYTVKLTFGSVEGGMNTANLEAKTLNLCNISGTLEEVENDGTLRQGTVKLFDSSNNLLGYSENGNFNLQASNPASTITIQGAIKEGGEWKSYVRTMNFDGTRDHSNVALRTVSFPTFCSNADFKAHMGETNTYSLNGLSKWDLDKLQKVEVLKYNPVNSSITFTDERQEFMRSKITNPSDVRIYVEGRNLDVQVDTIENQDSQKHYSLLGEVVIPDEGYIIVVPVSGLAGGQAFVWDANYDGEIEKVKLNIGTGAVNDAVVSHEFGHGLISPDHAYTLSNALTIMVPSGIPEQPRVADAKSAKIVYENTYLPKEKRDDILGQSFNDGVSVY